MYCKSQVVSGPVAKLKDVVSVLTKVGSRWRNAGGMGNLQSVGQTEHI